MLKLVLEATFTGLIRRREMEKKNQRKNNENLVKHIGGSKYRAQVCAIQFNTVTHTP